VNISHLAVPEKAVGLYKVKQRLCRRDVVPFGTVMLLASLAVM
jgi:hypothetical protein